MDLVAFSVVAFVALVAVALVTPAVSFVKLRKERDAGPGAQQLGPVFLTEVLIWLAFVLVFGFVMLSILGLAVFVMGHAAATSHEQVNTAAPVSLVLLVVGCIAGLALVGWRVHSFAAAKLRGARAADAGHAPPTSGQTES
jgi:hypothetical protein